jgi:hypothetical protein
MSKKRTPVRTKTVDEDDTLRLAHIIASVQRRASASYARCLVRRAFGFLGHATTLKFGKVVEEE